MPDIILNNYTYNVNEGEFVHVPHDEYNNLRIYPEVGRLERIVGLICDIGECLAQPSLLTIGWSHGGFVPINCAKKIDNVCVHLGADSDISHNTSIKFMIPDAPSIVFINRGEVVCDDTIIRSRPIILSYSGEYGYPYKYKLSNTDLTLHIDVNYHALFMENFYYYFNNGEFAYDNLIHLIIMVKNGGDSFEQVLQKNLPIIDRWTILDTGSTDGTIDTIQRVLVGKKKGVLYREPFINFRESRNRCFELAGTCCKYNLVLDDTYWCEGDVREFLNTVRGDQFATSYSLVIKSGDSEYYSNRITKSECGLRYTFTIHEVIQEDNNIVVVVPAHAVHIFDYQNDYMENRTKSRKALDIQLLYDMVKEEPDNPRHLYYLAQTYLCIQDFEKAAEFYVKRATSPVTGYIDEVVDSWFELARLYNFNLNKPWSVCEVTYMAAFNMDQTRPEPLYFIGLHYYLEGDTKKAFEHFKRAFHIGFPVHAQFGLKPTLSYHFLPKFLTRLCYEFNDYPLGLEASRLFLGKNKPGDDQYEVIESFYSIFENLCKLPTIKQFPVEPVKPVLIFVAYSRFTEWTGRDILKKGMGGSETYIIEMARWIQRRGCVNVIVFCNCNGRDTFEDVQYRPIDELFQFIATEKVHTCIVSRFSEYIPVCINGLVDNIYFVLHDLRPSGIIIPMHQKIKAIFCLTGWHKQYFLNMFPQFSEKTHVFGYGIDANTFAPDSTIVRNSFIYSSYPNRGLVQLLQMWPRIRNAIPDATLNIYSDVNGAWANAIAPDDMRLARELLANLGGEANGIHVHGWVGKDVLARAWGRADVWFYPCTFMETYCLTAMEAAASRTLAISNDLAALGETVGERGLIIRGNPSNIEWQDRAVRGIVQILNDTNRKWNYIESNYAWAAKRTWEYQAHTFIDTYIRPSLALELNYVGMYNWIHDLPHGMGCKDIFESALSTFSGKGARILEIGTYTGTSIIYMLRRLCDATAVVIDRWKSYDEDSIDILKNIDENDIESIFHMNVRIAGLSERIVPMKGDSVDKLCDLIHADASFDFIYVDGSHKCIDCYTDMTLSWRILTKGGIMAVDDYCYNIDRVHKGDTLEYPYHGVEHFLHKYTGKYEVIDKGYRVFIKKIHD